MVILRVATGIGRTAYIGNLRDAQDQETKPCLVAYDAASARLAEPVLPSTLLMWWSTVRMLIVSSSAISRLVLPSDTSCKTSVSLGVSTPDDAAPSARTSESSRQTGGDER